MDSAALTLTLFSRGWLYFDSRAITWDGTRHTIPAPEINGAQIMDIITFSNSECGPGTDLNDVCATAFKGMQAVAEDTDLRTERSDVHPSLLGLMPEGDVTGISLVSLLGAAGLWSAEQAGADSYAISCDEQLATGIPECEHMLAGVVDALRSADPSLCGEASYSFLHTSGAELPEPVDEAESADEPVVGTEPEPEVQPEPEPVAEPEPEPEPESEPEPVVEPEAELEPEVEVEVGSEPESESAAETEPEPEVELEPNPIIEPEVATESDTESEPIGASAKEPTAVVCDGMRIDLRTRLVHVFDREVQLYRREFDLLVLLARNPESTYSTASIRDALGANCELNSINMYVGLVRSKIGDDPNYPQWVATVEGGYRFVGKNPRLVYEEEAEVLPIEYWRSANDGRLLVIDRVSETAAVDGELAHLSKKEFAILSALTSRQGGVWENEELSQLVLGVGFVESSRALSTYMNKIRSVLGDSPKSTSWIKTVRGVGYRMIGTLEPVDLTAHASGNDNSPIASQETNADYGEALEVSDVAPDTEIENIIDIQPVTATEVTEEPHADEEASLQDIASQPEPMPSNTAPSIEHALIECDELVIDLTACSASMSGQDVALSPHEYGLLVQLATHPGISLTREALVEMTWGKDTNADTRIVDTHIKNIRAKLGDDAAQPRYIKTVHGYGYRFIANIDQSPYDSAGPTSFEAEVWRSQTDERVLTVNHTAHLVEIDGDEIMLTISEYEALAFLSGRQGQECGSDEMTLAVLGANSEKNTRGLASHIKNLRAKLNDNARNPSWIKTVHGKGYQMTGTLLSHPDDKAIKDAEPPATKAANECETMTQDALRIAMEFDTLGAFDPALSTAAVEADVAPEPAPEPEAVPAAEPEPMAEPAPAPEIDPAALSKLEDAIAEATRELAALDPKPLQDKLDALTQERAGLGFFKFSAKKEIDQKITAVERELAELKSRDSERRELKTLLDDYAKQHDDLLNAR